MFIIGIVPALALVFAGAPSTPSPTQSPVATGAQPEPPSSSTTAPEPLDVDASADSNRPAPEGEAAPAVEAEPVRTAEPPPPASSQHSQPTSVDDPHRRRVAVGGALLGAGVTFSFLAIATFAARPSGGMTDEGAVTFDPGNVELDSKQTRTVTGVLFGLGGTVLSGIGGAILGNRGTLADDPARRQQRLRTARILGGTALGIGTSMLLGTVVFGATAGVHWSRIPDDIDAPDVDDIRNGNAAALFTSWALGLGCGGAGLLSAGIGLLSGAQMSNTRVGMQVGPRTTAVSISGRF